MQPHISTFIFQSDVPFKEGTDKHVNYMATIEQLSEKIKSKEKEYQIADVIIGVTQ